jgi:hypothetical protein
MAKVQQTLALLKDAINVSMANSEALDGDCKECRVKRICQVTEAEAKALGRNWNVDMFNGECKGECLDVLEKVVVLLGQKYDAIWPSH